MKKWLSDSFGSIYVVRVFLAAALVLATVNLGQARQAPPKVGPEVSITSPEDGSETSETTIDVTVSFSASKSNPGKGAQGNVKLIQLLVDGEVVASFDNPPQVKSGTHTFSNVDLPGEPGDSVTIVAVAYQGALPAGVFTASFPVTVSRVPQAAPSVTITAFSCVGVPGEPLKVFYTINWKNMPNPQARFKGRVAITFLNDVGVPVEGTVTFFDTGNLDGKNGSESREEDLGAAKTPIGIFQVKITFVRSGDTEFVEAPATHPTEEGVCEIGT